MENDQNYDSISDVANESEKSAEDVKASEEREENGRNYTEQLKGATDGEEEDRMKEEIKVADASEVEERNEEKSKAVHPIPNEELAIKNIPSESTSSHPNPPSRQRKKNRPNSETGDKETHEKAYDGRKVSEENKEDKEVTDEPEKKTRRRKSNAPLQNEIDGTKSKSEKTKDTKEDNNTEHIIRNRDNNIYPKIEDEGKLTTDNNMKETDLEQDKEDKKDTENSIKNRDKKLPKSEDEGKQTVDNNMKEKDLENEDDVSSKVGLKKELGLVNSVGIIVGNIIGTGIFVSPRAVLQYSGSVGMSLIVWVLSGVMCIVGAFCYADIPSGRAVAALTFANYVLQPFFPDGQPPPDYALRLIGIALIATLAPYNPSPAGRTTVRTVSSSSRPRPSTSLLHPSFDTPFGPAKRDCFSIVPSTAPYSANALRFTVCLQRQVGKVAFRTRPDRSRLGTVDTEAQAHALLNLKDLDGNPFDIMPDIALNTCTGTVSIPPRSCPVDDTEWSECADVLLDLLTEVYDAVAVYCYTIPPRGHRRSPTNIAKVTFKKQDLPDSIYVAGVHCSVKPYRPTPRQCQSCWHFGHPAQALPILCPLPILCSIWPCSFHVSCNISHLCELWWFPQRLLLGLPCLPLRIGSGIHQI
ncbi:Large neutral amino acids transporter small subunit 2 [Chionoecetes opilio]|uniref:Large neutral amino acids transporter small subunit 2 n=1 Tax=Chionoecetes opilio TaxID=41210 RepID=A0A8J5CG89_CHIOP|nr:Large neutral amino acids transporter small subunit 2 [Chionoecetes opilio]